MGPSRRLQCSNQFPGSRSTRLCCAPVVPYPRTYETAQIPSSRSVAFCLLSRGPGLGAVLEIPSRRGTLSYPRALSGRSPHGQTLHHTSIRGAKKLMRFRRDWMNTPPTQPVAPVQPAEVLHVLRVDALVWPFLVADIRGHL
jgi:hypothetical protein